MVNSNIYKVVIDSMSAHVAILDKDGEILETNQTWKNFAQNNGMIDPPDSVGLNYLHICQVASDHKVDDATTTMDGIRQVLSGELPEFFTHYPCHSPEQKRWYALRVVPYQDGTLSRVIVTHEDITPIIETQVALEKKKTELLRQSTLLEESNIALRVLLRQRNEDKKRIEETIFINVDRLVLPYVEKLTASRLSEKQKTLAEVIDNNLRDIISPFLQSLNSLSAKLSHQETEVANLVRSGRTSKEIAEILGISVSGVDFHRKRLRHKLGLTHSNKNLRTYLLTLDSK